MKLAEIKSLGEYGVISDRQAWALPPNAFTSGRNFRLANDIVFAYNGTTDLWTPVTPFNAGFIEAVKSGSDTFYLIAGRSAVYAFDGLAFFDVTSTAGYSALGIDDELLWQSCKVGVIPVLNNRQHYPEFWAPQSTSQILQPLPFDSTNTWQDKGFHAKLMRAHGNFLFALGLVEGGIELPNMYRWSHPADINGLPFSWDEADLSTLASKESIGGSSGSIVDGKSLRDAFAIYSQNAINILTYTGDEFVFARREMSSSYGLLSRNCVVEVQGSHIFLTDGDILVNDGNSLRSIIHNKMRKKLVSSISTENFERSFAIANYAKKEAWFCITEEDTELPTLAFIYNWEEDKISLRDLDGKTAFLTYGPKLSQPLTWNNMTFTWQEWSDSWDSNSNTPFTNILIGVDRTTSIVNTPEINNSDYNTVLERTDLILEDAREITSIIRVYPHVICDGPVLIRFGSQDFTGGPVRWKDEVSFNPNTDRKIDVRTTGALHAWRIQSVGTAQFSLSGIDIEYINNGRR